MRPLFFSLLISIFTSPAIASDAVSLSHEGLQNYFRSNIPALMEAMKIPGVAIVVVKGNAIIYSEGFGYGDIVRKSRIDPETSLFRIGSVTKPFTATAILQLVEQQKLKLSDNANQFFEMPASANVSGPVTIANLLTHTGGIEEKLIHTAVHNRAEVLPLNQFLEQQMPLRVLPAGKWMCYSNHGYVLLGHIVERVSGKSLEAYFQENIFAPLNMKHSWYGMPPDHDPDMVTGYEHQQPVEPAHVLIGPAAAIIASANDVGRFLIAQLNQGAYGQSRIFSESTSRLMTDRQFTQHPSLPGMTYGFYESNYNRIRSLYHEGGIRGYSCLIYLCPKQQLGLFVVNNGYKQGFHWRLCDDFLNHFFPAKPDEYFPKNGSLARAKELRGNYRFLRYSRTTIEKLALLRRSDIPVHEKPDGRLDIGGTLFVEISPLLFQQVGSYERAAFLTDSQGNVTHLSVDQDVLEKVPWYKTAALHQVLLFLFVIVFIVSQFGWSKERTEFHLTGEDHGVHQAIPTQVRWIRLIGKLNLAFLISLVIVMIRTKPGVIWYGVPFLYYVVLTIPIFSLFLLILVLYSTFRSRKRLNWPKSYRFRFCAVVAANVLFFLYLNYWNLLGYRF